MIQPTTSPSDLASLLGTTHSKLNYTLYSFPLEYSYTKFTIEKKNGSSRQIRAPNPKLKIIQKRLKNHLEKLYRPHSAATAFVAGRGIVDNAKRHIKRECVFNLDLDSFFDYIHFGRVKGLLVAPPYNLRDDTAKLIAHICCLNGRLPQGAPTSPLISNMVARSLDHKLSRLAKKYKARYSRYADDITFSFQKKTDGIIFHVDEGVVKPSVELVDIIENAGFLINIRKTRVQYYDQRQVVTGLKVNSVVNVDRRYIRTTRAMLFSLSQGVESANMKFFEKVGGDPERRLENVVHGRIAFIGMVKGRGGSVYQTLSQKFNDLGLDIQSPIGPAEIKDELEQKLHFYSYKNRARLQRCVWVVDFGGVPGLDMDQELVQGTAFMIGGQRILTSAHTFAKAGNPVQCKLYLVNEPGKKYSAEVVNINNNSDIAELKLINVDGSFPVLKVAPNLKTNTGYKVSIAGFPQLQPGHQSVAITPCTVINTLNISSHRYIEVDTPIQGGSSGSPVLNVYMQVVGMAAMGVSVTKDGEDVQLEGTNAFVSAVHFP
ncbi:reverse transcriptase domain-containing protein [Marinobacter maritimus]|uniref:reverse transcriptase domain-containing protein n=1 Tax=Marinobacter maritimus TaxID=277961 RepID=UPI0011A98372|nr:reverse transcriptase domain-containing protein [Marinobacter maritimus]